MSEAARLADQLRRSYQGEAWHGPALMEVLEGVNADLASRGAEGDLHTIWEIVLHVTAWAQAARRTIVSKQYVRLEVEADWPTVSPNWRDALDRLDREQRALWEEVSQLPDDRLDQPAGGGSEYSVYVLLHGVVQHNLYHAGQIAILKKVANAKHESGAVV